jgi:hypothetical protein
MRDGPSNEHRGNDSQRQRVFHPRTITCGRSACDDLAGDTGSSRCAAEKNRHLQDLSQSLLSAGEIKIVALCKQRGVHALWRYET